MAGSNSTTQTRWQQLQELAVESARTQLRLAKQYVDATQRLGRDGWPDAADVKRLQTEGEHYLRELAELNLRYARSVQDLARESGQRLFDVATSEHVHESHAKHSDIRLALDLSGPWGGEASGSFTVANTRTEIARVSFEAGRLRRCPRRRESILGHGVLRPGRCRPGPAPKRRSESLSSSTRATSSPVGPTSVRCASSVAPTSCSSSRCACSTRTPSRCRSSSRRNAPRHDLPRRRRRLREEDREGCRKRTTMTTAKKVAAKKRLRRRRRLRRRPGEAVNGRAAYTSSASVSPSRTSRGTCGLATSHAKADDDGGTR